MRKIFMALAVVSVVTACNSKENEVETSKEVISVDTSGLYNSGVSTDTATLSEVPVVAPVTNKADNLTTAPKKAAVKPIVKKAPKPAPTNNDAAGSNTVPAKDTVVTTTASAPAPAPAEVKEKKGMSSAAKGAIIGGVGGAVGGAIISKKKGKGAIIGGAVGAAGGYILGRKKDKKNQAAADTTE